MNDESSPAAELELMGGNPAKAGGSACPPSIPSYLQETYWWAYLHPRAVWLFEREWLVNLILWGQMRRLTDSVLEELGPDRKGSMLQVACVYGDFTRRLARRAASLGSRLHLADIAPIQLRNARAKLAAVDNVEFHHQDSSHLHFGSGMFARSVVFFLLHEQPAEVRRKTIAEAIRVTRPGGRVVFVDYHRPHPGNPLRYVMRPILKSLEPFALDLWKNDLMALLPGGVDREQVRHTTYGGGLYQKLVIQI